MKTCTKCKITKDKSEFSKNKANNDGFRSYCKWCANERSKTYSHTKDGVVTRIYGDQRGNSRARGHSLPTYSSKELKEWLFSQDKFHILYDNWKRLEYQSRYRPSVDRKKDSIGYTMDNIQLMTWEENKAKGHSDHKTGTHQYDQKAIAQFDKDGTFVTKYISAREASRQTGYDRGNISSCCLGKSKSAYGFKWEFAKIKQEIGI